MKLPALVAAQRIGRETVNDLANIHKYYVAYKMVAAQTERVAKATDPAKRAAR